MRAQKTGEKNEESNSNRCCEGMAEMMKTCCPEGASGTDCISQMEAMKATCGSTAGSEKTTAPAKTITLEITRTDMVCALGEEAGRKFQKEGKIPVFSCEGGCIKGEIARLAANMVAKEEKYARACHGELFSVPHSELAGWVKKAGKVVVIDGCSIRCHGRIAENIVGEDALVNFDALSIHRKYANLMDVDDVPEAERKQTAKELANTILASLKDGTSCVSEPGPICGCGSEPHAESTCAG